MRELPNRASESAGLRTIEPCPVGDDILRGADEIAIFLFGDASERRKVYHLASKKSSSVKTKTVGRLPIFRLGAVVCARRSILLKWIEEQEKASAGQSE